MRRRDILGAAPLLVVGAAAAEPAAAPVLVELFTSQGCSSCPPADRLLGTLAARPDVLALAFHVTYWDRLGWTDTFGDPRFTMRQQGYADRLGGGLYTPEVVIGGELALVGSDPRIEAAVGLVAGRRVPRLLEPTAAGTTSLPMLEGGDASLSGPRPSTIIGRWRSGGARMPAAESTIRAWSASCSTSARGTAGPGRSRCRRRAGRTRAGAALLSWRSGPPTAASSPSDGGGWGAPRRSDLLGRRPRRG